MNNSLSNYYFSNCHSYQGEQGMYILVPYSQVRKAKEIRDSFSREENWRYDRDVSELVSHTIFTFYDEFKIDCSDNEREDYGIIIVNSSMSGIGKDIVTGPGTYKHIGNISLRNISFRNSSAELVCLIGEKEHWNKGLMTEFSKFVFKRAFDTYKLERVWSGTSQLNVGMQRVFSKLKMVKEGSFRKAAVHSDGTWDIFIYSILNSEYSKIYKDKGTTEDFPLPNFVYSAFTSEYKKDREGTTEEGQKKVPVKANESNFDLIDKIKELRTRNNENWMDMLKLAFELDGDAASLIMQRITETDKQINELSFNLGKKC